MPEEKEYKSNSYKSKAQRTGELAANDIPETKIVKVDPKTPVKVRKKSGFANLLMISFEMIWPRLRTSQSMMS